MLAYVRWVGTLEDSGNGIKIFRQWGAVEIIDVSAIDRCIGFLKLEANKYAVVDRESRVTLR